MTQASFPHYLGQLLSRWGQRLLIVPPILVAIFVFMLLVRNRAELELRDESEAARVLSTIRVPSLEVRPRFSAFGTSEYGRSWRAISQVSGRIVTVHPELRPGAIISPGELLVQIDDQDYQLELQVLEATIKQTNAEIAQLSRTKENYDATLAIENKSLLVFQRELDRARALLEQNAGSESSIDESQRSVLSQEKLVQDIENNIALIQPQIDALNASIEQATAQKEQASRDIERTGIYAPFLMRVGDVELDDGQFVAVNEVLFEGYSFAEIEIEVQVRPSDLRKLLRPTESGRPELENLSMQELRKVFDFSAQVRVAGQEMGYQAEFLRVREVVDSNTRLIGLVLGVTNQLAAAGQPATPPLVEGAFCDVIFTGPDWGRRCVIPRSALHGTRVYVVDDENRLREREVLIDSMQNDSAVLRSGLSEGERLIVSNPSPAVIGMLVDPVDHEETEQWLVESIDGGGAEEIGSFLERD